MIENLAAHLAGTPEGYGLSKRLVTPSWMRAWGHWAGTLDGFVEDVRRVQHLAMDHHDDGMTLRCVLARTSIASGAGATGPEEVRQFVEEGHWTYARALSQARLVDRERTRAWLLAVIVDFAPDEQLAETERLAREIRTTDERAMALSALSRRADRPELLAEALADVKSLRVGDQPGILRTLIRDAPEVFPELDEHIAAVIEKLRASEQESVARARYLRDEADELERAQHARLSGDRSPEAEDERKGRPGTSPPSDARLWFGADDDYFRVRLAAAVLDRLSPEHRMPIADVARAMALEMPSFDVSIATFGLLLAIESGAARAETLEVAIEALTSDVNEYKAPDSLETLLALVEEGDEQRLVVQRLWEAYERYPFDEPWRSSDDTEIRLLTALAPVCEPDEQEKVLGRMVALAPSAERLWGLATIVTSATGETCRKAWEEVLRTAPGQPDRFADLLESEWQEHIPEGSRPAFWSWLLDSSLVVHPNVVRALALVAPDALLEDVWRHARALPDEPDTVLALLALRVRLPRHSADLLAAAEDAATALEEASVRSSLGPIRALLVLAGKTGGRRGQELITMAMAGARARPTLFMGGDPAIPLVAGEATRLGHVGMARELLDELAGTTGFGPAAMAVASHLDGDERVELQRSALRSCVTLAAQTSGWATRKSEVIHGVVYELAEDDGFDARELWDTLVPVLGQWGREDVVYILSWMLPLLDRLGGVALLQRAVLELGEIVDWGRR